VLSRLDRLLNEALTCEAIDDRLLESADIAEDVWLAKLLNAL